MTRPISQVFLIVCIGWAGYFPTGCGGVRGGAANEIGERAAVVAQEDNSELPGTGEPHRDSRFATGDHRTDTSVKKTSNGTNTASQQNEYAAILQSPPPKAPNYTPNTKLAKELHPLLSKMRSWGKKLTPGRIDDAADGRTVLEVSVDGAWIPLTKGLDLPQYPHCVENGILPKQGLFFDAPNPLVLGFTPDTVSAYLVDAQKQCISTWQVFEKLIEDGHRNLTTIRVSAEYTDSQTHLESVRSQSSGDFSAVDGVETLVATINDVTLKSSSGKPILSHVTRFGKKDYQDCKTVTATIFLVWGNDDITHHLRIEEGVPDCVGADAGSEETTAFTYGLREDGTHTFLSRETHSDSWFGKLGCSGDGSSESAMWVFLLGDNILVRQLQMGSESSMDSMSLSEDDPKYKTLKCDNNTVPAKTTTYDSYFKNVSWVLVPSTAMHAYGDYDPKHSEKLFSFELAPTVDEQSEKYECSDDAY